MNKIFLFNIKVKWIFNYSLDLLFKALTWVSNFDILICSLVIISIKKGTDNSFTSSLCWIEFIWFTPNSMIVFLNKEASNFSATFDRAIKLSKVILWHKNSSQILFKSESENLSERPRRFKASSSFNSTSSQ